MEDIIEKAQFCLNCKVKPCKKGCPMENDIPSFIQCIKKECARFLNRAFFFLLVYSSEQ